MANFARQSFIDVRVYKASRLIMKPLRKTSKTLEILQKQGVTLTSINIKMQLPNKWINKQTIVQVNRGAGRIIQGLFRNLFRIDFVP